MIWSFLASTFVSVAVAAEDLSEFSSKEGWFKILMPGTPKERKIKAPVGPDIRFYFGEHAKATFLVTWVDVPGAANDSAEKNGLRLDAAAVAVSRNLPGGKITKQTRIKLDNKYPGRDLQAASDKAQFHARIFLVKGRLFQVKIEGPASAIESPEAIRFLDSFALVKQ